MKIPKAHGLICLFVVTILCIPAFYAGSARASKLVTQTWLPGDTIFPNIAFTQPLPIFGPGYNAALPRVDAAAHPKLKVTMKEIQQPVLPGYGMTNVWAYEISDAAIGKVLGPAHWPAVTIENRRHMPTTITYVNHLPSYPGGVVQGLVTVDQTIHWADPLQNTGPMVCGGPNPPAVCLQPYTGPVPAVSHLHGGEVPSIYDGGPNAWFTPNGLYGAGYNTIGAPMAGQATYRYPNDQEPGTLWFHDHALGATRTNVYSGLATFYFLRDPKTEPDNLPTGAYEIEMAIQDRQFDTQGQLYWPDGSGDPASNLNGTPPNPTIHPFWIPEFFGDVVTVNGAPWPVLQVEPRRYLFRVLDGSNARTYNLAFGDLPAGETRPPVYVVGSDDNYLDKPARINYLFMSPGERYYVIVDFTGMAGRTVTVKNDAPAPYPSGLVPGVDAGQLNMDKIMQFKVTLPLYKGKKDTSCNPAMGGCRRETPMVRLADGDGDVARGVKIDKVRQLVLKEHEGPGGPVEVFVNNTRYDGTMSPNIAAYFPRDGISELPRVGSTELWEVINLTVDAHPMHTHLTQFQLLNREAFDPTYNTVWGQAFIVRATGKLPARCSDPTNLTNPCPGYGPPLPYTMPNKDGALGGNPAIGPYLTGIVTPPSPAESGWKDTAKAYPGSVTRYLVRWAPTDQKKSAPGQNFFTFDPTAGPGYVWHCHIVDHEDNDMMQPYRVVR